MTAKLTKRNLRTTIARLESLRPPGPRPLTAEELVEVNGLIEKYRALHESVRPRPERGRKLFEWRIPCSIAPTQNEATSWNRRSPHLFKKAKGILSAQLAKIVEAHPDADLFGAQRKRWVRVTRFTLQPKNVDEERIDAIGGKLPVDVLKHAGLIVNDSKEWLERRAHVMKTSKGNKHVHVELFEVAEIEVPCGPPLDGPAPPDPLDRGVTTKAILNGGHP